MGGFSGSGLGPPPMDRGSEWNNEPIPPPEWTEQGQPHPLVWGPDPGPPDAGWPEQPGPLGRSGRYSPTLLRLTRLTGLLLYGESGLTPAAFKNIATGSMFLVILWIVDFFAWSGLWNMFLTGGIRETGPLTVVAVFLGLAFASVIMLYESSFLSADFRSRKRWPRLAVSIRVTTIILIALATSIPIDLFLLTSQVDLRIHHEQVFQQLPDLVSSWEEANKRTTGETAGSKADIEDKTSGPQVKAARAKDTKVAAEAELNVASSDRAKAEGHLRYLERQLADLTSNTTNAPPASPATTEDLRRLIVGARSNVETLRKKEAEKGAAATAARTEANNADLEFQMAFKHAAKEEIDIALSEAHRYEQWIHKIWNTRPKINVTEEWTDKPLHYDGKDVEGAVGIGDRLIVLGDLLSGRPARRPPMSEPDRAILARMRIADVITGLDVEATKRQESDASSLRKLAAATFIGFSLLPCLILALKLIFEEDTALYFNRDHQRALGFPDLPESPTQAPVAAPVNPPNAPPYRVGQGAAPGPPPFASGAFMPGGGFTSGGFTQGGFAPPPTPSPAPAGSFGAAPGNGHGGPAFDAPDFSGANVVPPPGIPVPPPLGFVMPTSPDVGVPPQGPDGQGPPLRSAASAGN
jgi:hypothetical protein